MTGDRKCGIDLLEALASNRSAASGGLTVPELGELTSRHRNLVSRTMADLVAIGLVERAQSFKPPDAVELADVRERGPDQREERLRQRSGRFLVRLTETCGESAYTVIRAGSQAVTVAEATPSRRWWSPLWSVAPGRLRKRRRPDVARRPQRRRDPHPARKAPPRHRCGKGPRDDRWGAGADRRGPPAPGQRLRRAGGGGHSFRRRTGARPSRADGGGDLITGPSARVRPQLRSISARAVAEASALSAELGAPPFQSDSKQPASPALDE